MTTTASAIDLPPEKAIEWLRAKVNTTSSDWTTVWQRANARAFTVAGAATEALVVDFRTSVAAALESGTTLADFRKDFDAIVAKHGWVHNGTPAFRSQIIFETNLSMAYSAGRYAEQVEPAVLEAYPYWQYVHSGSLHPRHQHLAWDGLVLWADDAWWSTNYPPNGWRCGCWVRPVSARDLARMGRSGPDTAPRLEYRDWTNRKTGEVHKVPVGIDPGFDYNPGAEWKGEAKIPDSATLRVPPKPTPAAPPIVYERARTEEDLRRLDEELTRAAEGWSRRLSEEERAALAIHKGSGYQAMNGHLRGRLSAPAWVPAIDALDAALSRAKLGRNLSVFRGAAEGDPLRLAKIGDVIADLGFTSTSLWPAAAEHFGGIPPLVVEIRLPKGYIGGAYVNRIPKVQLVEHEFLIRPRSRFRVVEHSEGRLVLEPVRGRRRRP